MPKGAVAAKATKDEEAAKAAPVAPDTPDERDARIAELEAKLAEAENRGKVAVPEGPKDYVWPEQTPAQAKVAAPAIPTTRVIKIGHLDVDRRFMDGPNGEKIVKIGQFRVPLADGKWDLARVKSEMDAVGIAPLGDIFPDAPNYCQLRDCWRLAEFDGAFCHVKHREFVQEAHDRRLVME